MSIRARRHGVIFISKSGKFLHSYQKLAFFSSFESEIAKQVAIYFQTFFAENSVFDTQSSGAETVQKVYFPNLHVHFFGEWRVISEGNDGFWMNLENKNGIN